MKNLPFQVVVSLATLNTTSMASANAQTVVAQMDFDHRNASTEKVAAQGRMINELWQQASQLRGIGKYSEEITIRSQIVKLQPDSFLAWYWRGDTLSSLGQYEAAIASYDQAIKIKPNYLLAWFEKGKANHKLKRYDAVITAWKQAVSIQATSEFEQQLVQTIIPKKIASVLLYDLKRYSEAIAFYNQVLEVDAKAASIWIDRGTAFYQLGRYQKAITDFDKAIQLDAQNSLAWKQRGFADTF
ncbi:tetratricopeptide repeat protein [Moorena sp. SIO2C4]|uniref:tetratricopeptide repeat protein n=1 Tax=Moorena sp. SIO2C4 TaxID=2607824 RepID=UPI0013CACBE6|nr:tetratricopeptide repeat protein [Moorena sp. SIO2C4]NES44083.1 tetratricopeptide repeat protein [Moorena sp. SIO2C4]